MAIHILSTGDPSVGAQLQLFASEFGYAMGSEFDLEKVKLLKPDDLVLSLVCIDPKRGILPNGTTHKRSASEFWTTYNVDYPAFTSATLGIRLAAIRDGFVGAISQVPPSRMQDEVRTALIRAAQIAVDKLLHEPERLPK